MHNYPIMRSISKENYILRHKYRIVCLLIPLFESTVSLQLTETNLTCLTAVSVCEMENISRTPIQCLLVLKSRVSLYSYVIIL